MIRIIDKMPELEGEELMYIQDLVNGLSEFQVERFIHIYRARRVNPTIILLCTLAGFLGFAGIQRFVMGQIGMGLLFLFTYGLCLIGTIIDLLNHKRLAFEHNMSIAQEVKLHL